MPGLTRRTETRRVLDWDVARERLQRMAANDGTPDPAAQARVLQERARALARQKQLPSLASSAGSTTGIELMQFRLGQERYAIESAYVHQVLLPRELTRLPGAPAQLRGVTNLRGEILPVFDLRDLLEAVRSTETDSTRWLLLGAAEPELCLWADAVDDLCRIDPAALIGLERDNRSAQDFVRGITQDARSVLDAALLLSHPALFIGDAPGVGSEGTRDDRQ